MALALGPTKQGAAYAPGCGEAGVVCFTEATQWGVQRLVYGQPGAVAASIGFGIFPQLACEHGATPDGCVAPGAVTAPYEALPSRGRVVHGPPYYGP